MIAFVIYLLVITGLIFHNGLFGIFNDTAIHKRQFAFLFLFKALAVPVFYFVYEKLYGNIHQLDAGKFFDDAVIISNYAKKDPEAYIKLLLGLQDETAGSSDYSNYLRFTMNWDNGKMKDYLYNDNRIVIRLHSLFNFVAFGSYFVHALLNCLLGFIGIVYLYRSISQYFKGRELMVLLVLCFFPALWFYTGGVLKEGIALFVIGTLTYILKTFIINAKFGYKRVICFVLLFFTASLLKPYLTLFTTFCFALFFLLNRSQKIRYASLVFFLIQVLIILAVNFGSVLIKGRSLAQAVKKHQRVFSDVAKGGIFLSDSTKTVRLKYNMKLVKKVGTKDSVYTIAYNAPFVYREHSHDYDTLYCHANKDTLSAYTLLYFITQSKSNIDEQIYNKGAAKLACTIFYYSLFYPFFFNARGALHYVASLENLLLAVSLLIIALGLLQNKKPALLPFVFVFMALAICLLSGLAAPNSGAIFRYRSPVVVFILLAALYYLPHIKKPNQKYF